MARVQPLRSVASLNSAQIVEKSRVLIGALSRLEQLRVKRLLESQPDIDVIGPIADAIELLLAVREIDADAVILPLQDDGEEPGLCSHLLAEYPGLLVLAVSAGGRHLVVFHHAISKRDLADGDDVMLKT